MLTVWAVFTGDKYARVYLDRLAASVRRHLPVPHRFRVITDHELDGYDTVPADPGLPGWWQKLRLFDPAVTGDGHLNLYIDLDSVIVASLAPMLLRHAHDDIAMPANWAMSGHGGCQSSVMIWQPGQCQTLYHDCQAADRGRCWGDQEWITNRLGDPGAGVVTAIPHPDVVSYKYHCLADGAPPPGARIVTFHGLPDPHEVTDAWVREHWG